MSILTLIATLLETLGTAVPGIASGQSALAGILDTVLVTAAQLIRAGEAGSAELQALTAHIQAMVSAGTDPTEADWTQLKTRSDTAHALIQASSASGAGTTTTGPSGSGASP